MNTRVSHAPAPAARRDPRPRPVGDELRRLLAEPGGAAVLIDGSRDPNASLTVLLIAPGADEPHLAVKVATTAAAAQVVEREARFLAELRRRPLPRVEQTLPCPAGLFDVDGMLAAATSVVPGAPMRTRYQAYRHLARRSSVRADFAAAGRWLAALHADTSAERAPVALLEGTAERIGARWPGDPQASLLVAKLRPLAERLSSATAPRTVVHGDFWAGNLLIAGATITGVVDWAAGELSGEPLRDVARFALSYSLYLDRHTRPGRRVAGHPGLRADGWGAGIRYAIAGQHWFGRQVRDFTEAALARLGAPAELWREVLLAGIAEAAATADHPEFAARHRDLLLRLIGEVAP